MADAVEGTTGGESEAAAQQLDRRVDDASVPARLEHLQGFQQDGGAEHERRDKQDAPRIGEGKDKADQQQGQGPLDLRREGRNRAELDRPEGDEDEAGERQPSEDPEGERCVHEAPRSVGSCNSAIAGSITISGSQPRCDRQSARTTISVAAATGTARADPEFSLPSGMSGLSRRQG